MAENSAIEWCDHTFNPWIGCTKVSPACDNCYAERDMDHRFGRVTWGPGQRRSRTTVQNWYKPRRWNREAAGADVRPKVFCASLADVFDVEVPEEWVDDLFNLIRDTPNLDWLLLTKRPQVAKTWFKNTRHYWPNVWLGTTVENQDMASARLPHLFKTNNVAKKFLSMEPLLEHVDIEYYGIIGELDWVIVGGESGPNWRPMEPSWAELIKDQCHRAGVSFFMKQMSGNTMAARKDIPPELMLREIPA